ncbi:hypothetical protein [Pseudogemmobacter sp. W21_MBD1_M6]|uniref:hypothetical protein n=1 Tax=Pseudogemmobacter sp. W21_MBD1_M6 TaxID=3240271 RepID=UPI003F9684CB
MADVCEGVSRWRLVLPAENDGFNFVPMTVPDIVQSKQPPVTSSDARIEFGVGQITLRLPPTTPALRIAGIVCALAATT